MFEFYNANPNNVDIFDCSIRSLSKFKNISWREAYQELSEHGRKLGLMMDSVKSLEHYLDTYYERECFTETTVREFVYNHPKGRYIISMSGHLTSVIDGINYDTFPTLDRKIWCVWTDRKKRD